MFPSFLTTPYHASRSLPLLYSSISVCCKVNVADFNAVAFHYLRFSLKNSGKEKGFPLSHLCYNFIITKFCSVIFNQVFCQPTHCIAMCTAACGLPVTKYNTSGPATILAGNSVILIVKYVNISVKLYPFKFLNSVYISKQSYCLFCFS